ncbi:MAG: hypothetical protein ACQEWR_00675 [Bacillota bacterium]
MHIYYYDENFMYIGEDVISDYDEPPKNTTSIRPQDGLCLPMYNEKKEEWSESATQEYIDSLQPDPGPPSDIELLKQQNADLLQQLAESEKRAEEQSKTTAELVMLLTEKGVI